MSAAARIGPYELRGEIGRGGAGVVYAGWDPRLQRDVAVKVLRAPNASDAQLRRFAREARSLAKVRHPNVVAVHEVGHEQGRPYIVMDRVRGESLQARIDRDGPLAPREAAAVCARLARALEAAHGESVVHRDVKPDNVIVGADGAPLLTDFGLAKDLDDPTASISLDGRFIGTPGFAAPEQTRGSEAIGAAVDVYGLGATLFAMVTGVAPFSGESLIEIILATSRTPATPPSSLRAGVGPDIDAVCLCCLEKDPARRFGSVGELAEALERVARGDRPDVPASRASDPPAPGRRSRAPILLSALAALLAAVAIGLATTLVSRSRRWADHERAMLDRIATLERAEQDRLAANARDPERLRAALERGDLLYGQGDLAEARAAFEEALLIDADSPGALIGRGNVRTSVGDTSGALADFDRALVLAPDDARAWTNRAAVRYTTQDYEGAESDASRALALEPGRGRAWHNRSLARRALARLEEAEADATRAVELLPEAVDAWSHRGLIRLLREDNDGADADSRRALELDPRFVEALVTKAHVLRRRVQRAEALAVLDFALEVDPRSFDALIVRAQFREDAGLIGAAIEDLERANALSPSPNPLHRLALLLHQGDRSKDALGHLDRALELAPGHAPALSLRATVRYSLGDIQGSIEDLDRFLEVLPDDAPRWAQRGIARRRLGDLEGAIADLDEALRRDGDDANGWRIRAECREETGDIAGAVADYETMRTRWPGTPAAIYAGREIERLRELDAARGGS